MLDNPNDPSSVTNVWGGDVSLEQVSNTQFALMFEGVPASACADLLTRNTGSGRDTGLVAAGTVEDIYESGDMPITVSMAVELCSKAGNFLAFVFTSRGNGGGLDGGFGPG